MKQINDKLDTQRKTENKKTKSKVKKKEKTRVKNIFKGSKYPLLKNEVDLLDKQK